MSDELIDNLPFEAASLVDALWERSGRPKALIDEAHRFIKVNPAYEDFVGLKADVLVGKHVEEVVGAADYAKVTRANLDRCLQGEDLRFEAHYEYPSAGPRWVSIEYTSVNANGRYVLALILDSTELRLAERTLSEESARLAAVIDGTRAATWQWNVQTGETFFNERWAEIIGYTLEELAPISIETWTKLTHPDDLKVSEYKLIKHFSGEVAYYDCEARMKHKDGHWVWVHDRGRVASWDEAGKPISMYGTHVDVTKRKEIEQRNEEMKARLFASERILSDITNSVPGALLRYRLAPDGGQKLLYLSDKAQDIWEVSKEDAMADVQHLWSMVHEEYLESMQESIVESAAVEAPWEQTWQITTPSGQMKWLTSRGQPRKQSDGSTIWNTLILDISQLKRTEERLRQSEAEARQADASKTEFLNMMNHELRTPLNAVLGPLDLLEMGELSEEARSLVALMKPSAEHLLSLISDILSLSKMQAGKHVVEFESVDLSIMLEEILRVFIIQAEQKGLKFGISIDDELPNLVRTDPRALKQILFNLVSNAIKFTPRGEVNLGVTSCVDSSGLELFCFKVKDTGIGIAESDLEKVFQPFRQIDMGISRSYQGTGLGLTIASELADILGGGIVLDSKLGEGSEFSLRLPLAEDVTADSDLVVESGSQSGEGSFDGVRVLVVEDTPANITFIRMVMDRLGVVADFAADGQAGMDLFLVNEYQIVFLDIRLPDIGGEVLVQKMRAALGDRHCRIIANTAYASDDFRKKLLGLGFDDFLPKPMTYTDVQNALSRNV